MESSQLALGLQRDEQKHREQIHGPAHCQIQAKRPVEGQPSFAIAAVPPTTATKANATKTHAKPELPGAPRCPDHGGRLELFTANLPGENIKQAILPRYRAIVERTGPCKPAACGKMVCMEAWFAGVLQWLALPQFGLSTVFVVALVSATLLPMGSSRPCSASSS